METLNSRHHLIAKDLNGTNSRDNVVKMNHDLHKALHTLFGNAKPADQILQLVMLNLTAFTDDTINDLFTILDRSDEELYKKVVVNGKSRKSPKGNLYFETLVGQCELINTNKEREEMHLRLNKLHNEGMLSDEDWKSLQFILYGS